MAWQFFFFGILAAFGGGLWIRDILARDFVGASLDLLISALDIIVMLVYALQRTRDGGHHNDR